MDKVNSWQTNVIIVAIRMYNKNNMILKVSNGRCIPSCMFGQNILKLQIMLDCPLNNGLEQCYVGNLTELS